MLPEVFLLKAAYGARGRTGERNNCQEDRTEWILQALAFVFDISLLRIRNIFMRNRSILIARRSKWHHEITLCSCIFWINTWSP